MAGARPVGAAGINVGSHLARKKRAEQLKRVER
jgi:hypothetical protein